MNASLCLIWITGLVFIFIILRLASLFLTGLPSGSLLICFKQSFLLS